MDLGRELAMSVLVIAIMSWAQNMPGMDTLSRWEGILRRAVSFLCQSYTVTLLF